MILDAERMPSSPTGSSTLGVDQSVLPVRSKMTLEVQILGGYRPLSGADRRGLRPTRPIGKLEAGSEKSRATDRWPLGRCSFSGNAAGKRLFWRLAYLQGA